MKLRRIFFLVLALAAAFLLAFPLRSVIQDRIILPAARILWLIRGYYGTLPQAGYWIVALIAAGILVSLTLRLPDLEGLRRGSKTAQARGPVEEVSFWLQHRRTGNYPRWYLARMLADLAASLLGTNLKDKHTRQLTGEGWDPPSAVQRYLEAGLATNYADFQRRRHAADQDAAAFDQDLEPVIDYLESYLETDNDHDS